MSEPAGPMRVGVVAKRTSEAALATARELAEWLSRRGREVLFDEPTAEALRAGKARRITSPSEECDLIVVLGGDGTLLSVARTQGGGPPILGVNLGRLGFLTEIPRAELYPALIEVLAGRYRLEARSLFDVELKAASGDVRRYRALNDAVIAKSAIARIIDLALTVDGVTVARYRSDGLVVSTPTGSTAYNLSAGGPIVHPLLPVTILTPICPHALTLRPIVVPDSSVVEIVVESKDERVYLTVDGQEGSELADGDRVKVTRAPVAVRLARPSRRTFFDGLRGKLHWGE